MPLVLWSAECYRDALVSRARGAVDQEVLTALSDVKVTLQALDHKITAGDVAAHRRETDPGAALLRGPQGPGFQDSYAQPARARGRLLVVGWP